MRTIPLANVDDAVVDVAAKTGAEIPPSNVLVPVDVELIFPPSVSVVPS